MPVDFQIKSAKVVPKGALALIMHASELAQGNYWQKIIAQEALKAGLGLLVDSPPAGGQAQGRRRQMELLHGRP